MRQEFHDELDALQQEILRMGTIVVQRLSEAVRSLAQGDLDLAQQIVEGDDEVDRMQADIDTRSLALIATQQPLASDLRMLGTAIKVGVDLERMSDHATDIAKVVLRLDAEPLMKPLVDIPRMAEIDQRMIQECLKSFVNRDASQARDTMKLDDEVDHLYGQVLRELLTFMIEDPKKVHQAAHLILVSQYLERVGDHATNLGEGIVFMVTGERVDLNR